MERSEVRGDQAQDGDHQGKESNYRIDPRCPWIITCRFCLQFGLTVALAKDFSPAIPRTQGDDAHQEFQISIFEQQRSPADVK
jgi:hypothetical protein